MGNTMGCLQFPLFNPINVKVLHYPLVGLLSIPLEISIMGFTKPMMLNIVNDCQSHCSENGK